jgi:hypothetical protein
MQTIGKAFINFFSYIILLPLDLYMLTFSGRPIQFGRPNPYSFTITDSKVNNIKMPVEVTYLDSFEIIHLYYLFLISSLLYDKSYYIVVCEERHN